MKNRLILGCDLDSTIWDSQSLYSEAAEELFGHGYSANDVTHYYWLRDEYGENYWQIFDKALHPDWIHKREMYPHVVDTVEDLKDFGVDIHFVTHNVHPDLVREPLKKWLQEHFGEVGLSVTSVGKKVPILKRIGAFGIVDDKPKTLQEVKDAGLKPIAFLQPWNREFVESDPYLEGFGCWKEGYDILIEEVLTRQFSDILLTV
jgi:hypothetical protein